jgi:hypothetical protein
VIFDGANGELFVSEDGGISWQQSMRGMGVRDVYSIYQSAARPEHSMPARTVVYFVPTITACGLRSEGAAQGKAVGRR